MAAVTRHLHGDLLDTLDNVLDYLDNQMDVVDGDYGEPRPNQAMSLHTELARAIERLERDVEQQRIAATDERKIERIIRVLKAAKPGVSPNVDHKALASGILMAIQEQP